MKNKKKIIIIASIIAIILIAVLCTIFIFNNNKPTPKDEIKIEFYDNGSMGNYWSYEMDNEGIVSISSDYDYSGCGHRDGCGGSKIYTIKALKPGNVTITFNWISHSNTIEDDAIYKITVNEDLSITEEHSGSYFK